MKHYNNYVKVCSTICILFLIDIVRFWSVCGRRLTISPLKSNIFKAVKIKKIMRLPFALGKSSAGRLKLKYKKKRNYILAVNYSKR